jgi:predicted ATPase/class 3 adenylate cyclase
MSELPSGTVSLLFSDIEGSTVLLSRLGAGYADAMDGQRQVLRKAWADHGGTELGTEGDSFMVVFPTAEGAVAAAAQAQRELAAFDWPGGEQVRVRMGIHTGTPTVHDGGYVGMDVHRAARIAGAAHGGQVVLSSATAELVAGCLPDQVDLRDLGRHQLKDIAHPEHLFQLVIEGLRSDFSPLKALGAASSLPRPATPLVGRDGELAELTALLGATEVRLVTLTGPGGSGKTRLAIAVAEKLVEQFPDGVYFVPLAAVTTAEVMWTSIGEALDVPPEARTPPELFSQVAHRHALFVLDNLEQVIDADDVVTQLVDHAPEAVVLTTSRRALSVPGEHVHPVPPLELPDTELPDTDSLALAGSSAAVQLFVHQAQMVRPSFELSAGNAGDVTAICRRLDGLPLAIELAAARTRLLGPTALLARLDTALDIAATGKQGPTRQKTLRDTLAWSYDLLNHAQQAFFRRLGVFAGGADLEAIQAVAGDVLDGADPLDLIADLLDASLATLTEDDRGEPRVSMLVTIQSYAHDQLAASGELDQVRRTHALHYLVVAERLEPLSQRSAEELLAARRRFEVELDNFREALAWALQSEDPATPLSTEQLRIGRELLIASADSWWNGGYYAEARRWLERAVGVAGGDRDGQQANSAEPDSVELGQCLDRLASIAFGQGDYTRARSAATQSVAILRRLHANQPLTRALSDLANNELWVGDVQAARATIREAVTLAEEIDDRQLLAVLLERDAAAECLDGNFEGARDLYDAAAASHQQLGDETSALSCDYNSACMSRLMGRLTAADQRWRELIPQILRLADPEWLATTAEDYGAVLAELGEHHRAARLLGAAEAMRERNGTPRHAPQQAQIAEPYTKARAALPAETWQQEYQAGRDMTVEVALTEAPNAITNVPTS